MWKWRAPPEKLRTIQMPIWMVAVAGKGKRNIWKCEKVDQWANGAVIFSMNQLNFKNNIRIIHRVALWIISHRISDNSNMFQIVIRLSLEMQNAPEWWYTCKCVQDSHDFYVHPFLVVFLYSSFQYSRIEDIEVEYKSECFIRNADNDNRHTQTPHTRLYHTQCELHSSLYTRFGHSNGM